MPNQNKGVVGIPVAKLPGGEEIIISTRKVEQIDTALWGVVVAICAWSLIEIFKMLKGKGADNSKDIKALFEGQVDLQTDLAKLTSTVAHMDQTLKKIQEGLVTEARVQAIAEDRIAYVERIRERK